MAEPLRRIAVLTRHTSDEAGEALERLARDGERLGLQLLAPQDEADKHPRLAEIGYEIVDEQALRSVDACLVLGGDGTILRALGRLLGSPVPTLGVNYGTVGFLAALARDEWWGSLQEMLEGSYRLVELLTVDVHINGERFTAVNDVVLSRVLPRHVLELQYRVSGVTVGEMLCDGLIVASPTGSTAYNLSCGGPIVEWDAHVLVLNFIAPHSLGFRPVVLRPDHEITVRNVSDTQRAEVVADGDTVGCVGQGDEVRVAAGEQRARLLVRDKGSFYQNVQEKLFHRHDAR